MVKIDIEELKPGVYPRKGSADAAAYDLRNAGEQIEISFGHVTMVHTGIRLAIPSGYCGLILPRSGLARDHGVRPINTPGLIDADYRGEVMVALECVHGPHVIKTGDRIAQLLIVQAPHISFNPVDVILDNTARGDGGFGSSGR